MRREAQSVVLMLVGGTMVKIAVTGSYVRYVKTGLGPYLLAAGAVLAAVGVASLVQAIRTRRSDTGHAGDHHGHGHGRFDVAWLLLIPMLALLLIAPPSLGSYSAARSGTALSAPASSNYPPLPDGDPVRISVASYATRAVYDKGHTLANRTVTLSGFLVAGSRGEWYVARMVITCCAADARPVKVGLTGDLPGDLRPDGWVQVTGRYTTKADKDPVNAETIPYLQVQTVSPIAAPARQYES
jgi:uncharacterized repeat protein (TIGR03943 family)